MVEQTVTASISVTGGTDSAGEEQPSTDPPSPTDDEGNGDAVDVTPRIGPVEPITMSAEYQLPFSRDTNQTACGETLQQQNGDLDWRIVFDGVVTLSQLDQLRELRSESGEVETRSAVFGVKTVTFDQLSVSRTDDNGTVEQDGTVEPLYEFQLQTKELSDGEDGGIFG